MHGSSIDDYHFGCSVLTPHYQEDINFSTKELHSTKSSVSIIFYMQKIFPGKSQYVFVLIDVGILCSCFNVV